MNAFARFFQLYVVLSTCGKTLFAHHKIQGDNSSHGERSESFDTGPRHPKSYRLRLIFINGVRNVFNIILRRFSQIRFTPSSL